MTNTSYRHCDVVVVGARAAGAATALLLARLGHNVLVVDQTQLPSDTVSTHQISRSGMVQLRRWGVLDEVLASGAPPIRQVSFTARGETITREIKEKCGVDHLVAPRRYVLDTILVTAAERAGAEVRFGTFVEGVRLDDDGGATGVYGRDCTGVRVEIEARCVVGADGLRSRVARAVGAEVIEDRGNDGATQYAYYAGPSWTGTEYFAAERSLVGVFPTHHGEACIWVCIPSTDAREARRQASSRAAAFDRLLDRAAPALAARLRRATRTSPIAGMLRMPNHLRRAQGAGWALVGDAGYHRDAVTGHGISDAYRDAELLATALDRALRGTCDEPMALACYQRQRDVAVREIFELTCAMASYPPVLEFTELQRQLSQAIEAEAAALAARAIPGERPLLRAVAT